MGNVTLSSLSLSVTSDTKEPSQTSFRLDLNKIRRSRMARNIRNVAKLLQEDCASDKKTRYQSWFVTVTYRNDIDWQPRHMTQAIKCFRSWCNRRGVKCRYVWVAEIQNKRKEQYGSHGVHYHLMVYLPLNVEPPRFDGAGWWPHGIAQTALVRGNAAGYMAKAAYNGDQSQFPKGCRMFGSGGLSVGSRLVRAWWALPRYVRAWFSAEDKPIRNAGGWVSRLTGEWKKNPFKIESFNPLVIGYA